MTIHQPQLINIGHTEIVMRFDGIVEVNASDHMYSIQDIRTIQEAVINLTDNKKALLLFIPSNYTSFDNEARNFLSTPEASSYAIAKAYIIKSLAQRILLNFMTKVTKMYVPVKFFQEINAAVKWLKSFNQNQGAV